MFRISGPCGINSPCLVLPGVKILAKMEVGSIIKQTLIEYKLSPQVVYGIIQTFQALGSGLSVHLTHLGAGSVSSILTPQELSLPLL